MHVHPSLEVFQLSTLAELASLRSRWNELAAGIPTRSWEWIERWWRVYGNTSRSVAPANHATSSTIEKELYLLAVFESPDRLIAIAPWYIEHSLNYGRTLRFLGSGEICTDYSTILCEPGRERPVTEALARTLCNPLHVADWLTQNSVRHWDRIEFTAVAQQDRILQQLLSEMERHNNLVHRRITTNSWQIELPKTWPSFLAQLSKSHRKQLRRCQREFFDTGRAKVHWVENEQQLDIAWELLVRLHQERQQSLGNPGCFASAQYATFHRGIASDLLRAGKLWLGWLELDGRPLAVDYQFVSDTTVFVYQGGIDPSARSLSPGQLIISAGIQRAIAEGYSTYDLLRGDEPYKPHWRAEPQPLYDIRIVKRTASNQVRKQLWVAGDHVRNWLKLGFGVAAPS
jgi:hypothetical protein